VLRWACLFVLLSGLPALAQTCGPDPAPAQAAAQGFNCETFRWASGDTIGEIDTGQAYLPGSKWYYGTAQLNGHTTVGSDFTVAPVTGSIRMQTTETNVPDYGAFSLNTCGAPSPTMNYTVGKFFRQGWYIEAVMRWDATGHTSGANGAGMYGLAYPAASSFPLSSSLQWEIDNPDAYANDQELVFWGGGTPQGLNNTSDHVRHGDDTIQTGHKFGAMSTASAFTWWWDDTANGSVDFAGSFGGFFNAMSIYNNPFCFGTESTPLFPQNYDSIKIWQAGGPPPPPAAAARLLHK